jgi:hypothetical protein
MERNKHIKKILLLSIALLCTCCKQRVSVGGVILDEKTRKPVAKVYISQKDIFKNTAVEDLDSSDENGRYKYDYLLIGKLTDIYAVIRLFGFMSITVYPKNGWRLAVSPPRAGPSSSLYLPPLAGGCRFDP